MSNEKLILYVQSHSELYDVNHPKYDNHQRKDMIWKEIAKKMNLPTRDCKEEWKRIRSNYRRAVRLRKLKSSKGIQMLKRPRYENILSFLEPFITSRKKKGTNQDVPRNSTEDTVGDHNSCTGSIVSSADDSRDSYTHNEGLQNKYILKNMISIAPNTSTQFSSVEPVYHPAFVDRTDTPERTPDNIVEFFKNLGKTVKTFPVEMQIKVKRDIFNIVSDAEEFVIRNRVTQ